MSGQPAVVVNKKGGFFTALAQGLFGFLIVLVVCVTVIALYWGWVFDKKTDRLVDFAGALTAAGVDWQELLPPVLADALDDRRALDYQDRVIVNAEAVATQGGMQALLEISNEGDELISTLTGRVVFYDARGIPVSERMIWAVTPITANVEDESETHVLRGPLLPGNERRFLVPCEASSVSEVREATFEITELRVWVAPVESPLPSAAEAETTEAYSESPS